MGKDDNRRSAKMRRLKRQVKKKTRIARTIAAGKANAGKTSKTSTKK